MLSCVLSLPLLTVAVQSRPDSSSWYVSHGYPGFGMFVGPAGDVNADGVPDFVVGDPGQGATPPSLWILSGKDRSVHCFSTLPGCSPAIYSTDGGVDVDRDGVPDLLIAVSCWYGSSEGWLYLVSGKTGAVVRSIPACTPNPGSRVWARFCGDLDRDGVGDIGALCPITGPRVGTLTIYSGRTGAPLAGMPVDNPCQAEDCALVPVPDADGDGKVEFLVVVDSDKNCSASYHLYSTGQLSKLWERAAPQPGFGGHAGATVLGDNDKDGVQELAISSYDRVEFVNGRTGAELSRLEPKGQTDSEMGFGWALATLGDIDQDGFVDFAVSETESGMTYGTVFGRSGRDGRVHWEASGDFENEVYRLGYQLAAIGDIDGDGITDLVAGTWEGKAGVPGLARVLSGKTGSLISQLRRQGDHVVSTK